MIITATDYDHHSHRLRSSQLLFIFILPVLRCFVTQLCVALTVGAVVSSQPVCVDFAWVEHPVCVEGDGDLMMQQVCRVPSRPRLKHGRQCVIIFLFPAQHKAECCSLRSMTRHVVYFTLLGRFLPANSNWTGKLFKPWLVRVCYGLGNFCENLNNSEASYFKGIFSARASTKHC